MGLHPRSLLVKMRRVSLETGSPPFSQTENVVIFILEGVLGLGPELQADSVGNEFYNQVPNTTNYSQDNGNNPVLPWQSTIGDLQSCTAPGNNDGLTNSNQQPDSQVHFVCTNTLEDVFLIINLSGVDQVEDLDDDEDVEYVGVVSTGAKFFSIFAVKRGPIPISQPSRKNVWVLFVLESPFESWFWVEVLPSKHDDVQNYDLVDGHPNDVLKHLSRDDVLISPIRGSVKEFSSRRFGS